MSDRRTDGHPSVSMPGAKPAARSITMVPAYGRDYTSADKAERSWNEGDDFRIADVSCRWDGAYVNVAQTKDLIADGRDEVKIRYKKLTKFTFVKLKSDKES